MAAIYFRWKVSCTTWIDTTIQRQELNRDEIGIYWKLKSEKTNAAIFEQLKLYCKSCIIENFYLRLFYQRMWTLFRVPRLIGKFTRFVNSTWQISENLFHNDDEVEHDVLLRVRKQILNVTDIQFLDTVKRGVGETLQQ